MPTENKDDIVYGKYTLTHVDEVNPSNNFEETHLSQVETRVIVSRTWNRTAGYKSLLKSGNVGKRDLPMNPYTSSRDIRVINPGTVVDKQQVSFPGSPEKFNTDTFSGTVQSGTTYAPPLEFGTSVKMPDLDLEELDARARTRYRLELKDSKSNLAVAFAESGQTYRLINSMMNRLNTAIRLVKRGDFRGAASALDIGLTKNRVDRLQKVYKSDRSRAFAQFWLEIQYGVRPFVSDIIGVFELVKQKTSPIVRSKLSRGASATETYYYETPVNQASRWEIVVRRKTTIRYVVYFSTSEQLHTLAQVGLTNLGEVLWERTPWSFVLDWLINIGGYISSLDATVGLGFEKGCKSTIETVTVRTKGLGATIANATGDGRPKFVSNTLSANRKIVTVQRQVLTDWPSASRPVFKNPFSAEHLANALALLKTNGKTVKF